MDSGWKAGFPLEQLLTGRKGRGGDGPMILAVQLELLAHGCRTILYTRPAEVVT